MKHLFAACTIALGCAAPAWAQDGAFITQREAFNSKAFIEQIASLGNNYAVIEQVPTNYAGGDNVAQVLQQDTQDAAAWLYQSGNMNRYTIMQTHGQVLRADINSGMFGYENLGSEYNTVTIEQSGYQSSAGVNLGGDSSYNEANIVQNGGFNQAGIRQYFSSHNTAAIQQTGSGLQASVDQIGGGGNRATIRQGY